MARVKLEQITKEFPTRGEPLVILREVSLELAADQSVAIMGPSGSGKSTLLNIVGTLEPPTSGRVLFDGQDPALLDEPSLAAFRNRQVGFVFQDHHLLPQCTVMENVLVPTIAAGATRQEDRDRAARLLDRVGLGGRLDHRPAELSGGERQRAAIARALIRRPVLLLADEPTGNLDHTNATAVARLLLELQKEEGTLLVVVTHSSELAGLMRRRFLLDDGRLRETTVKP
jgi:lipoprotein-releasing system ATP-binding protein